MRYVPDFALSALLCMLLSSDGFADAEQHEGRFDNKQALQYSQAVIGKSLADLVLLDTSSKAVALSDFRGKPLIISMIYTSCHHICPTTTHHLNEVITKAQKIFGETAFNVLTIGFDTFSDSPQMMKLYASERGVTNPAWRFLSGDRQTMQGLMENLGFLAYPAPHGFDHLIQATIVDAEGVIYSQVYGIEFELPLLMEPLKELIYGRPRVQSVLAELGDRIRLFCTIYDPQADHYRIDYSVFIGTFVGVVVSIVFGVQLVREWRRSIKHRANQDGRPL
jgi:protein SCO1/2